MTESNTSSNAGKRRTTSVNASTVPRPNNIPIDEIIGSDDVIHKIKPTLERIDAGTAIEKMCSFIVFKMASLAVILVR